MKHWMYILMPLVLFSLTNMEGENSKLDDGEKRLMLNGVEHWVKIKGLKNNTVPIVIVHGGPGGNNYNFEKTAGPFLEKFATIVYYDQRGCGRSKAPKDTADYKIPTLIKDLECLRINLELDEMNLLGYSFGAELALRYAEVFPNHVKKLILSSPAELSNSVFLVQIQGFYSIADNTLRNEIENVLKRNLPVKDKFLNIWNMVSESVADSFLFVNQDIAKQNRQMWNECSLPCEGSYYFRKVILENSKGDLLETAENLNNECLIISGINDKNGGLQTGVSLNKMLPNSELKLYKKSAHFPDMEESWRYAKDIRRFILEN